MSLNGSAFQWLRVQDLQLRHQQGIGDHADEVEPKEGEVL